MKKLVLATAIALSASTAMAGTEVQPQMDVTVISQGAATSMDQGWLVPVAFTFILFLMLKGSSDPLVRVLPH